MIRKKIKSRTKRVYKGRETEMFGREKSRRRRLYRERELTLHPFPAKPHYIIIGNQQEQRQAGCQEFAPAQRQKQEKGCHQNQERKHESPPDRTPPHRPFAHYLHFFSPPIGRSVGHRHFYQALARIGRRAIALRPARRTSRRLHDSYPQTVPVDVFHDTAVCNDIGHIAKQRLQFGANIVIRPGIANLFPDFSPSKRYLPELSLFFPEKHASGYFFRFSVGLSPNSSL